MLLFTTPTGSRLYGTNHADSDYDVLEVYTQPRKTRHKKVGTYDLTQCSLQSFMAYVAAGSPQNLEALHSPYHDLTYLKNGLKPDYYRTIETYQRTIKSFYHNPKRRTHAFRLYINLEEFKKYGKINPRIDLDYLKKLEEQDILRQWIQ